MEIGYYIPYFPYKNRPIHPMLYAGPEVVAYNLAVNMVKRGHKINIFTTSIDRRDSIEIYENMTIYRYAKSFSIGHSNISFGLFQKPLKHQVDIVHAHGSATAGFAAMRYAKRKNIPFVLTHHGDVPNEGYNRVAQRLCVSFYKKYLIEWVLSCANVIISPSEYFIEESKLLGKYRNKIVVIPNGINIEEFNIPYSKEDCRKKLNLPPNKNLILFVGVLTPRKGPDILIKAMPKITNKVPDTELVFVGRGWMKEKLEMLSRKLGIDKHVKFAGFVEEDLKPFYYNSANLFVLASFSKVYAEVFPIVLLEASASGLPIVVSDIETFKCIIDDGYNGVVTKGGDENNLANTIIYLLENEEVRNKLSKNARKKVEDYSWERIAEETEKVYEMVTNNE